MTFSDALPYVSAFGPMLTIGWAAYNLRRAQWVQHGANTQRLDRIEEDLRDVKEITKQQTEILLSNRELSVTVKDHDRRLLQLEDHDAKRRVGSLKG